MNTPKHLALATLAAGSILLTSLPAMGQNARQFPGFLPLAGAPEGVAVDKVGNVYISLAATKSDQIWKFSPAGSPSLLADFGPPAGGNCGLAVDPEDNVYMARKQPAVPGVFRADKNGAIALLPGTENMVFPNALAFDKRGALYITETYSMASDGSFGLGGIWRAPKRGPAELWLRHELLTGPAVNPMFGFPVGANGIAFRQNALYVINSDKALVVRIPVLPDGSPGEVEVWKQVQDVPESIFYQHPVLPLELDGLALDVLGNAYIAVPSRNAVLRINATDGSQETLAVFLGSLDAPHVLLDSPLSVAFGTGKGERESLFITNGGMLGLFVPGIPWPGPSLVEIDAAAPGQPLP